MRNMERNHQVKRSGIDIIYDYIRLFQDVKRGNEKNTETAFTAPRQPEGSGGGKYCEPEAERSGRSTGNGGGFFLFKCPQQTLQNMGTSGTFNHGM